MNRYFKAVAAFGAVITLGACATSSGTPATSGSPGTSGSAATSSAGTSAMLPGMTNQWTATINPEGGTSITGTAVALGNASQTRVTVVLSGAMASAVHPWHIHLGQCGDNGAIVGPPATYPPLTVGTDGSANASATVPVGLTTGTRYYVNIHKSPSAMGTIVGCGNLTRAGS